LTGWKKRKKENTLNCSKCSRETRNANVPDYSIIMGDFNAPQSESAYHFLKSIGFRSVYEQVHSKEPEKTFPSGLKAPTMDDDDFVGCLDYIFVRRERNDEVLLSPRYDIVNASVHGNSPHPEDETIYPSDHFFIHCILRL